MANTHAAPDANKYYIPHDSHWPIFGSVSLFVMMVGAIAFLNEWAGAWVFLPGAILLITMFVGWFGTVIGENQHGIYNMQVDRSFRMGMMWFIFSEVMFFAAFFGALFYARVAVGAVARRRRREDLQQHRAVAGLRRGLAHQRPGPGRRQGDSTFEIIPGVRSAGDQHRDPAAQRRHGDDRAPRAARAASARRSRFSSRPTFMLGFLFVGLQAEEYGHAYAELGLKLSTGIYGSTFFMLTGFHGLHVTIGAIMLLIIWLRVLRGHFTPSQHFAFEAVAWYWHFVDVVWLGLFVFVYWI